LCDVSLSPFQEQSKTLTSSAQISGFETESSRLYRRIGAPSFSRASVPT